MHGLSPKVREFIVNGILLVGLIGLLAAYLVVVSDLPSQIYTPAQNEYLRYSGSRRISQAEPVWNTLLPGGQIEPAMLSEWETQVRATLAARYEERAGVCATIYDLDFASEYHFAYPGPASRTAVELFFPFPSNLETLHDVRLMVDGTEPPGTRYTPDGIRWQAEMASGEGHEVLIAYRADGANSFSYALNHDRRFDIVDVTITVLGLEGSSISEGSLPATESQAGEGREVHIWDYANLVPSRDIRLQLPTRLGFAQRVAHLQDDFLTLAGLAPFLVGLFLASLAGLLHLAGVRLRLTDYLLTGCGMALFYPTLTLLGGVVDVTSAACIAFLLISSLVLAFLGLAAGWRRTWWRVGLLLTVFLGIFSLGVLTPWRGLLLTGGGLVLVGTFMTQYAHRSGSPETKVAAGPAPAGVTHEEPTVTLPLAECEHEQAHRHCPHCGRRLAEDHAFCPGCGKDVRPFRRCTDCGHEQFVLLDLDPAHCIRCGRPLSETNIPFGGVPCKLATL